MSEGMAEAGDVDGSMLAMQQAEAFGKQHDALLKQFTVPERMMAGTRCSPKSLDSSLHSHESVQTWPLPAMLLAAAAAQPQQGTVSSIVLRAAAGVCAVCEVCGVFMTATDLDAKKAVRGRPLSMQLPYPSCKRGACGLAKPAHRASHGASLLSQQLISSGS